MSQIAFLQSSRHSHAPETRLRFAAALIFLAVAVCSTYPAYGSADFKDVAAQSAAPASSRPSVPNVSVVRPVAQIRNNSQETFEPVRKLEDQSTVPEIEMFVGESRVFPAPEVARIAVGSGQVMTASVLDDDQVIIFANGAGTSTLFLWHRDGRHQRTKVTVVQGDTTRAAREISAFLSKIRNATVSVVGDKVIVEGDELSDADRDKVAELAKRYPQIINFTSPIGWEQMVMMDVKVVEFPKTELRELGLKWSATGGAAMGAVWRPTGRGIQDSYRLAIPAGPADGLPVSPIDETVPPLPSSLTILSGFNLGLNAQLNLLEQSGKASILAEPQLSTRSGYRASFLAGGEFPYSVSTVNGVTVLFKPYGIRLDIDPRVGANGVIRAVVDSEVSSIDPSVTTATGPALLTRRTKTEFNVRNGETIVLSGLLQRSMSTDIDKLPMLGDLPILGALFRSKRFQNKETELVVFVTPTVVDSRSAGLADRIERTTEKLGGQLGRSPYLSDPIQPGSNAADFTTVPARTAPRAPTQQ